MKTGPLATARITVWILFPLVSTILPAIPQSPSSPQTVLDGRRIFSQSCAGCHNIAGTIPKPGPPLESYYHRKPRPSDAAVRAIIQHGKGKMPAFRALTPHQLTDLLAYLRTL